MDGGVRRRAGRASLARRALAVTQQLAAELGARAGEDHHVHAHGDHHEQQPGPKAFPEEEGRGGREDAQPHAQGDVGGALLVVEGGAAAQLLAHAAGEVDGVGDVAPALLQLSLIHI